MTTRYPSGLGSEGAALAAVADMALGAALGAYNAQAAGAVSLTAAKLINGVLNITSGTTSAVTPPDASSVVAAIPNCQVGSMFSFALINAGSGTATMGTATGLTKVGTTDVVTAKSQIYRGIVTAIDTPAYTLIGLLTAAS